MLNPNPVVDLANGKDKELLVSKKHRILILCLVCFLVLSVDSSSMIKTLPVDELVSRSDYIIIGEVQKIELDRILPPENAKMKYKYLRNEVIMIESLKGAWPLNKPMTFRTVKAEHWIEDNVEFPFPGTRVLIFVKRRESGSLNLVNGIQGLWPLQGDKLLRMGTGKTIEEIRAIIKRQAESRK